MELSHFDKAPPIKKLSGGRRKVAVLLLSAFLVFLFIIFLFLAKALLDTSAIYHGVFIDGKNMGGYTKDRLSSYLEDYYNGIFDGITLTISSDRFERNVNVSDLGIGIDSGTMAQKAYDIGRKGGILERLAKIGRLIRHSEPVELELCYDTDAFNHFLDQICRAVYQEIIPSNIVIMEDQVILCTGISGKEADRQ